MKHKRQSSSSKNGDEKSSKASSCNNDDDSDLDEGKTNCSDSGFAPTSDKTSDNESDASLGARISPNRSKKKRKDAKHDACCVDGFVKSDRTQAPISISPNHNGANELCKMFTSTSTPSNLLASALSCSPTTGLPCIPNATSTHNKMLPNSYSSKDGLADVVDCKATPLNWPNVGSRVATGCVGTLSSSLDPLAKSAAASGAIVPGKQLSGAYYSGRFGEESNLSPSPLSASASNIKRNNFAYNAVQGSLSRASPSSSHVYFNYRQIKSENFPSLNSYPASGHAIAKSNLYNSFGNYCSNAHTFGALNGAAGSETQPTDSLAVGAKMAAYEYGGPNGSDYKHCDYPSSKMSGNMMSNEGGQQFAAYGENGFNGHLSSSEHFHGSALSSSYNTYPNEQQQQQSKYLANYYDSVDSGSTSQHRLPSEYSAITLKQEQQLVGGYSNYQNAYYESGGNANGGQIAIAASPNSIHAQTRTPAESTGHFAKGATGYEPNAYSYCEGYSAGGNQYDFMGGAGSEMVPEYYQLS